MGKWVDEGENRVADILFGSQAVDGTLYIGLYTNDPEPAETANLAALTEPSGGGYARKALTRGSWTITGDHADYAQQVFTASGAAWGNVYGWFLATSLDGSGKLLCVEHFPAPYNIQDGGSVTVVPKVTVS